MTAMARLRREIRDLIQIVLAPGLPALLPWPAAFWVYRQLSRSRWLFGAQTEASIRAAMDALPTQDEKALRRRLRLVRLLDAADLYLARRTPVGRPPTAHFRRKGEWPKEGPFIALSFHYGNGMWMLRDANHAGFGTVMTFAPFDESMFSGRRVELFYAKQRWRETNRSAGVASVFRPRIREKLTTALAENKVVVGLLDVPPQLVSARQLPVTLLGQPATLPCGLLDLAKSLDVPVVPCWVTLDEKGYRTLHIESARHITDPAAELDWFAAQLDRLIRDDPGAWHFWPQWPQWLADAASIRAAHGDDNPVSQPGADGDPDTALIDQPAPGDAVG